MYDEQRVSAGAETSPCFQLRQQPQQDGAYLSQMLSASFTGETDSNSVDVEVAPGHTVLSGGQAGSDAQSEQQQLHWSLTGSTVRRVAGARPLTSCSYSSLALPGRGAKPSGCTSR